MTVTVRDEATADTLTRVDEAGADLYDPDGQFLGRFFPVPHVETTEPHIVHGDEGRDAPE